VERSGVEILFCTSHVHRKDLPDLQGQALLRPLNVLLNDIVDVNCLPGICES